VLYPLSAGVVTIIGSDAVTLTTCYLDDDGVYDPDATVTGSQHRFAAFGLPEGPLEVEVTWDAGDEQAPIDTYAYTVAADGIVPMYPALATVF
jgi:hypothetical protein